jgi:hypothetical protein
VSVPRELAQAGHLKLLELALGLVPQRRSGTTVTEVNLGSLSRDQLIAFVLDQREKRDQRFRRVARELAQRDEGLSRRFKQQTTDFMDENDELLRRLADG